jgi:DNA topoisomerase-2
VYQKIAEDKVRITELPVGTWTMPYITFLESLVDGGVDKAGKKLPPVIKDFTSVSTDTLVDITVQFPKGKLVELEQKVDEHGINGVEKLLKLSTTVSTTNMHLFDANCRLHKYADVYEIMEAFIPIRLRTYQKRKDYLVEALQRKLTKLANRVRYIQETLDDTIDLRKKTAPQVTDLLTTRRFVPLEGDFNYLIKMPMNSVTAENVASLQKDHRDTEEELRVLQGTTIQQLWLKELSTFGKEYDAYCTKRAAIQAGTLPTATKGGSGSTSAKPRIKMVKKT